MRIRLMALGTTLAASLAAQGSGPAFGWVGVRAGSLSFDPQEHLDAATFLGGQGGLVFDQQRYGLSLEGLVAHPKGEFSPDAKLNHSEFSATFLTGLAGDSLGTFWPYLGLGLGRISVSQLTPTTHIRDTGQASAIHASFGFLHRPGLHLIWGVEGRYLVTVTNQDRKELQTSVMLGMTWGGKQATQRPVADRPPPEVEIPPPPVVAVAPPPPVLPPPAPEPAPLPAPPPPIVKAAPPPDIPAPTVELALPPPPPPPPVLAPIPMAIAPVKPAKSAADASILNQRLDALRKGDMTKALELGRQRIKAIPEHHWTIRLEIANLPSTLANAVRAFSPGEPDLFIAPIKLRGGTTAYQLFLGDYASKAEAERAARSVPSFFLEGGQRPKPFLGTSIPTQ